MDLQQEGSPELFTDVCGHYCIFYIYNRCHNVKMNTTVNMFPSKVKEDIDTLTCC